MVKESLIVEGMTCQHCVQTITDALKHISGVHLVEVNLDNKEVKMEFDEEKTNLEEISSKIVGVGFELAKD
ncbi:MAG: heavy-metal-associated domain-containing protein [Nitrospinae bacterium]|nr:heavy-metal-associated domain-containing protein [Nitrospinota bacterium]